MQKITLSAGLVNSVLAYLGNRPYVETAALINAIQEEAKKQTPQEPEETVQE